VRISSTRGFYGAARAAQTEITAAVKLLSGRKIEIRAAHEIMAARTTQLAFLVDQLMPALQAKPPMLAGNVFVRWRGAARRNFSVTDFCQFFGVQFSI
jgi:hypothetical protein